LVVRVLVVEDDVAIASALVKGLVREGFDAVHAGTAADALNALPVDFVLLDLGLPDRDGLELFRSLRAVSTAPIIMVTARGGEEDRIAGLDLGADDYVVKPFGLRELVARINAVLRRTSAKDADPTLPQRLGDVEIDRRTRTVRVSDVEIVCTPKEWGILEFLARDPGSVITRQELLDGVWGPHWYGSTKMIDVHVASLRRKLGRPDLIETHRGVGFRVVVPG
jgi:two-component system response regulator RegX3